MLHSFSQSSMTMFVTLNGFNGMDQDQHLVLLFSFQGGKLKLLIGI